MFTYFMHPKPATKALLHATKYPHATVIGLLLGSLDDSSDQSISISDVIPLVHHWSDLTPIIEAGLGIADSHACANKLMIVGTYVARARLDDRSLDFVSQRISQSLKFENPIALVIDNHKPFIITRPQPSQAPVWTGADPSQFNCVSPIPKAVSSPNALADFDDHLEDIGLDWLVNPLVVMPVSTPA